MTPNCNILFVIPSLEIGGAQANMLRLANQLHIDGVSVTLVDLKPHKRDKSFTDHLLHSKIPIFSPPFFITNNRLKTHAVNRRSIWNRFILKLLPETWWIRRLANKHNIDLINSHMYLADLYLSRQNWKSRPPIVSKQCGCYNLIQAEQSSASAKQKWAAEVQRIFRHISGVITLTKKHESFLDEHGLKHPSAAIYNGIPLPKLAEAKRSQKEVGHLKLVLCARDEASKGWEVALLAVHRLLNQGAKISLDLIGSGPYIDSLKGNYEIPNIRFLGKHNSPTSILAKYDVGLLPTSFPAESLPNTVVEYQACGLATISTHVGEIPQLVIGGHNDIAGQLLPMANQSEMIESLVEAIKVYLEAPDTLKIHQENALHLRSRFDVETTAQKYLDFFHRTIANSHAP
jgi:glycosyltransferase involved in cell wall biosynthesis